MSDRCLACHTDIPPEFGEKTSLHGSFEDPLACRNCHPDHGGLNAALTEFETEDYPHAEFGFYLLTHLSQRDGSAFECQDCHTESLRTFNDFTCTECHLDLDHDATLQHTVDFTLECLACHDGIDTYGSEFDHQSTSYPLTGQHLDTSCGGCHLGASSIAELQGAPSECIDCHRLDDTHEGRLSTDCADCHSTENWQEATVDHDLTAFPLIGLHRETKCQECHVDGQWSGIPLDCAGCHTQDDVHRGKLGRDCAACHTAFDWGVLQTDNFDHDLTGYPLTGKHTQISECESCHTDGQFLNTPTQCVACHRQDDAHNARFGTDCETCHRTSGWNEATFDHDRSSFRLTGAHTSALCESCHANGEYAGTPTSCVACHATDDVHAGSFGSDCASCHSTTTWRGATFDHGSTSFSLAGKHLTATCGKCHIGGVYAGTPIRCVDCHSDDDAHGGSFGWECQDCHNTNSWGDATIDHQATNFPLTGKHLTTACGKCHIGDVYTGTPTRCVDCHSDDDAHGGSFGWECQDCHGTNNWEGAALDHNATGFPLNGKHRDATCEGCHAGGVYQGTPTSCVSCHSSDDTHGGGFGTDCASCHSTDGWKPAQYSGDHRFPLDHKGAKSNCATCHPDSLREYTCYGCHEHEPQRMQEKHDDKDIFDLSDCAGCHPNGKKD